MALQAGCVELAVLSQLQRHSWLNTAEPAEPAQMSRLHWFGLRIWFCTLQLAGKLPSSLICSGYMYLYIACMIFNRLMSAMSIDGIWQNNLIYFEIRRNAASHFGVRISYPCWLTAFSHSSSYTHWPATVGSFPVLVLSLVLYSYSPCLQSEQLVL